jgi:hypothetical protein
MKYQYSTIPGQSSCPEDDALRIAQAKRERESTCKITIRQSMSTKTQQELLINVVINN